MAGFDERYASKALGGTALGLAIPGTVAAVNQLIGGGGLGGLFGGGPVAAGMQKEILDLTAENAVLKANQFTMLQVQPLQVQVAQQGEQIACLNKQLELNNQIVDGKIAAVACTANNGITALQVALGNLQNTVNQVIQPFIPESKVVTPPTIATTNTATAGGQ